LDVFLSEGHGRVKANDGKITRDMQDYLNHGFADFGICVIKLSSVVPREGCAVIAVINVTQVTRLQIAALKNNRGIGLIVIMVFELNTHTQVI